MPRQARIVIPDLPHHVVQRGNRKQNVFFQDGDYRMYLSLLKEQCEKANTDILAYCLMPNHVHLMLLPRTSDGLKQIGEVHRAYTRFVNRRENWTGFLWQGRFSSYAMDEKYSYEALRYIELNPVRAGLCADPTQYRWSSARQRISGVQSDIDLRVSSCPLFIIDDWESYWLAGIRSPLLEKNFERDAEDYSPLTATGTC